MRHAMIIVDDDETDRFLAQRACKKLGLNEDVVTLEGGDHLLEALDAHPEWLGTEGRARTLVLLDLNMPRLSGFEVLAQLEHRVPAQALPVVVLTSSDSLEDRARARSFSRVQGFESKPVSADILRHHFDRLDDA